MTKARLCAAGRAAARSDRVYRVRCLVAPTVHAVTVSTLLRTFDPDFGGSGRIGWRAAVSDCVGLQRGGSAGEFRPYGAGRLPDGGLTPPKTHWARRIETGPFYAYPVRPGITFTYLGTRVNREARMMMASGQAAANMFAAGEIMAGNVLGQGYAAGIGMTIGSVFGRIAGQEAATHARN
jgi:FAD binding domain